MREAESSGACSGWKGKMVIRKTWSYDGTTYYDIYRRSAVVASIRTA